MDIDICHEMIGLPPESLDESSKVEYQKKKKMKKMKKMNWLNLKPAKLR